MTMRSRFLAVAVVILGLVAGVLLGRVDAQGQPPRPRPGLTAQQTKQAIGLAQGAMRELRKKTEGALDPEADPREYVVNVELLDTKDESSRPEAEPSKAKAATKATGP